MKSGSDQASQTPTHWTPNLMDAVSMAIVVIAVSTSSPIVAAATAPAIAMAFWRTSLGAILTIPSALRDGGYKRLSRTELRGSLLAGLMLAGHFALWVPAIRMTNVAASTALVSTPPIWLALISKIRGEHVPRKIWFGVLISFFGVLIITGFDLGSGSRALLGDLMSIAGAISMSFYMLLGAKVRQTVSTATYTVIAYFSAGIVVGLVAVSFGASLGGYSSHDWWLIVALTLGPQMLGHSLMNRVVRTVPATTIGALILLEIPGTAIISAAWLGQGVTKEILLGMAFILTGLVVITRAKIAPNAIEIESAL